MCYYILNVSSNDKRYGKISPKLLRDHLKPLDWKFFFLMLASFYPIFLYDIIHYVFLMLLHITALKSIIIPKCSRLIFGSRDALIITYFWSF